MFVASDRMAQTKFPLWKSTDALLCSRFGIMLARINSAIRKLKSKLPSLLSHSYLKFTNVKHENVPTGLII